MTNKVRGCLFILLWSHVAFVTQGQDVKTPTPVMRLVGLETGAQFFEGEPVKNDFIRGDMASYLSYYGLNQGIKGELHRTYLGAKVEFRTLQGKLGISSGLRFTILGSSVRKGDGNSDYFYFRYSQSETTLEFLKVKELNQKSEYISVPLEFKYMPFKPRKVGFYFLLGGEAGYLTGSKTTAIFDDPAMSSRQDGVNKIVGQPERFFSAFYGGAGISIGKEGKPKVSLGITAPVFLGKASSLVSSKSSTGENVPFGGGIHLRVQIPF